MYEKGVSRGIFSNEAGLGTGSIAHACADTRKPVKQGLFGIFEVFADTIVICTLTALVILFAVALTLISVKPPEQNLQFRDLLQLMVTGFHSSLLLQCAVLHFLQFSDGDCMGQDVLNFFFSSKVIKPFMVVYSLVAILGATVDLGLIWNIADTFNGLMAIQT